MFVGKKVDILITKTEFIIAEVKSDDQFIWLEPVAIYKNKDVGMIEPLDMSGFNVEGFKNFAKWKNDVKASDICKIINKIEFESFDRRSVVKWFVRERGRLISAFFLLAVLKYTKSLIYVIEEFT